MTDMNPPDHQDVAEAWRVANDADVARALTDLTAYEPAAVAVIQAEAHRRGIETLASHNPAPYEDSVYLRLLAPVGRFLWVIFTFLWRHRLLTAIAYGVAFRAASGAISSHVPYIHPFMWTAFWLTAYSGGLGLLCWPLRAYMRVACITAFAFLGVGGVLLANVIAFFRRFPIINSRNDLLYVVAPLIIGWLVPFAALSGVVFLRNRYRPVYPAGHCRKCGYNLHGLPDRRCPECGTPFEPPDATP